MKIYLAASFYDMRVETVADQLEEAGHVITCKWWKDRKVKSLNLRKHAMRDVRGVRQADVFVQLLPGRKGAATELGLALGCRFTRHKPRILIWTDDVDVLHSKKSNVFWFMPEVEVIVGPNAGAQIIAALKKGR